VKKLLVLILVAACILLGTSCTNTANTTQPTSTSTPTSTAKITPAPTQTKSFAAWKVSATSPNYDDLFRNNQQYVGTLVYYRGQVVQVLEAGQNKYQLRVNITEGKYSWGDTVYLFYSGNRFLENDVIEFVGQVDGLMTYAAVSGASITIPEISVFAAQMGTQQITITFSASIMGQIGNDAPEKTGYRFLVVNMDILNQGYNSFNTNPGYFVVTVNNVNYDYSSSSYGLPDCLPTVDVLDGGNLTGTLAFEIPSNTMNYSIKYDGFNTYNIQWVAVPVATPAPTPTPSPTPVPTPTPTPTPVPTPTPICTLYIQVNGSGTVDPAVGAHNYNCGGKEYIFASADPGWHFTGWTGGPVDSPSNMGTFVTVDHNMTVTANFTPIPTPTPDYVIYEITGTASIVDVTLNNPTGGTEQYSEVTVPHQFTYSQFPDDFLYISAQNQGEYGSVTVTIYLNNEVFKTATSEGAYVIATASGSK